MIADQFSSEIMARLVNAKRQRDNRSTFLKVALAPLLHKENILPQVARTDVILEMKTPTRKATNPISLAAVAPTALDVDYKVQNQNQKGSRSTRRRKSEVFINERKLNEHFLDGPSEGVGGERMSKYRPSATDKQKHAPKIAASQKQSKSRKSKCSSVALPVINVDGNATTVIASSRATTFNKPELSPYLTLPVIQRYQPKSNENVKDESNASQKPTLNVKSTESRLSIKAIESLTAAKANEIRLTRAIVVRNQHLLHKQKVVNQESMISKISRMRKFVKKKKPLGPIRDIEYTLPASTSSPYVTSDLRAIRQKQLAECDTIHHYLTNHNVPIKKNTIIHALVANEDYAKPFLPEKKVTEQEIPELVSYRLTRKVRAEALNELILGKELNKIRSIIFNGIKGKGKK